MVFEGKNFNDFEFLKLLDNGTNQKGNAKTSRYSRLEVFVLCDQLQNYANLDIRH